MQDIRIVTEPFEFISFQSVECTREINEHGEIRIVGIIAQDKAQAYQAAGLEETWVTVKIVDEKNVQETFFCGILTEMKIARENQVNTLSVTAKTGSYLLDHTLHIRSYQKESDTYEDILDKCITPDQGQFITRGMGGESIGRMVIQYQETDWEFAKRLAGYADTVVMPEFDTPGAKLYMGYAQTAEIKDVTTDSYQIIHNYEEYERRKAIDEKRVSYPDMMEYRLGSREFHPLGETVLFQGRELIVGKVASSLKGGELYHFHSLYSRERGNQILQANPHIKGISLRASVANVDKTMVQVQIHADENQENAGYKWFDYATVYSTPDGTGWYCMPEIGDEVRLAVPDSNEENAYVVSNVHLESQGGRVNPDEKSWKNKQGKEILFTPASLILRNNQGTSIELSDTEGIKAVSDKKIVFQAEGEINLNSQTGGVQLDASSDSISLTQGGASIRINDEINIRGGKIYMN